MLEDTVRSTGARPASWRVLLVEDSPTFAAQVRAVLNAGEPVHFQIDHVVTLADARSRLKTPGIDVILLDLWLPDSTGIDTFLAVRSMTEVPVVVLTGMDVDEVAMRAVQEGAQDYLVKTRLERDLLPKSLAYAIERHRLTVEASRARSDFFAAVSHEFRTPLFAIVGHAEMMMDEGFDGDPSQWRLDFGQTIRDSAEYVLAMVDQIIELSRLESGEVPSSDERIDLGSCVRGAAGSLAEPAARAGVEIVIDGDTAAYPVSADQAHVVDALKALMTCAMRRSKPGGSVRVSIGRDGDGVQVAVRDFGEPLPPEVAEHIFEPFARLEARSDVPLALAVSLAKRLLELTGGRLDFDTHPERGTVFIAWLRAAD